MPKKSKHWPIVCTRCLEEGDARWVTPGSDGIELLLYLVTLPLLCAGGLLYTGIRHLFGHWECRACSAHDVVPVGSFRGRGILQERGEISSENE